MARTHIRDLEFVVTVDGRGTVLRDATVVLDGPRIADVGPAREVAGRSAVHDDDVVVDGRRLGMIPGLIDTHVHLSETLARGLFPDNLSTRPWVFHWAKPFYAHVGPDDEEISVLLGAAEMLRSGTTCFLDMGAQNDPGITARAAATVGLRGIVGRHAADRKPDEIPPGWSEEMVEHHFFADAGTRAGRAARAVRRAVERVRRRTDPLLGEHRGQGAMQPRAAYRRARAGRASSASAPHTTSPPASRRPSRRSADTACGRSRASGEMEGLGSNLVLAHAVAASDDEVALLAEHDTKVAFCPATSLKLAKGATAIGKYPEMLERGVTVALGTDGVAAAGTLNLLRQMYLAAGLFKDARLDAGLVGAERALRMATIDGGEGARLGRRDRFAGAGQDEPTSSCSTWITSSGPRTRIRSRRSCGRSPRRASAQTWVDGRQVYANGRVRGVDEAALRAEARTRAAAVAERAGLLRAGVPTTTTLYGS